MKYLFLLFFNLGFAVKFCTAQVPQINSFTPLYGETGTTVTISGNNFSSNSLSNIVYFGAVRANVTAASPGSITVTVPYGATYEPITVSTNGLIAKSAFPFRVTFAGGGGGFKKKSFAPLAGFQNTYWSDGISVFDIDGDGDNDFIAGYIFKNESTGNNIAFSRIMDKRIGIDAKRISTGDLNGDGLPDIAYADLAYVNVYINRTVNGNINFRSLGSVAPPSARSLAIVAEISDLDLDGRNEIVFIDRNDSSCYIKQLNPDTSNLLTGSITPLYRNFLSKDFVTGDLNGDRKPDVVALSYFDSTFIISVNNSTPGNFSFETPIMLQIASTPVKAAIADIDNDGKNDIVIYCWSNRGIFIFKNTSTGSSLSFEPVVIPQQRLFAYSNIGLGDLDGDGLTDMCIARRDINSGYDSTILVLRNSTTGGNISFEPSVEYTTIKGPANIAVADFNMDGKPDILTNRGGGDTASNNIGIRINKVNEPAILSFAPTDAFAGGNVLIKGNKLATTSAVSFGGIPAASFSVLSDTTVSCVLGNGASGMVVITTANGKDSLGGFILARPAPVIHFFSPLSGPPGTVVVITGANFDNNITGNAVFFGSTKAVITSATSDSIIVTVPLNAGYASITVLSNGLIAKSNLPFTHTYTGAILPLSNSSFSTTPPLFQRAGNNANSFLPFDMDGDRKNDLLTISSNSSRNLQVFKNTSAGGNIQFSGITSGLISSVNEVIFTATTDFNSDGKPDIAAVKSVNFSTSLPTIRISTLLNTSNSDTILFKTPNTTFLDSGKAYKAAFKDLDTDGKEDVIVLSSLASASSLRNISIFRSKTILDSIPVFGDRYMFPVNPDAKGLATADFDSDGRTDIAVSNGTSNTIALYKNNTTGISVLSFSPAGTVSTLLNPADVEAADVDGDGKMDIVVNHASATSGSYYISVFRNTSTPGTISFANKVDILTQVNTSPFTINDFDGNGRPDVGFANWGQPGRLTILLNNSSAGNISFSPYKVFSYGSSPTNISSADISGDGVPDIMSTYTSSGSASYNFTTAKNMIPQAPVTVPSITSFSPVSGSIGSTVVISGTDFGSNATDLSVYFGTVKAVVTSVSNTAISVIVPDAGASPNFIAVRKSSLYDFSTTPFKITFNGSTGDLSGNLIIPIADTTLLNIQSLMIADIDGDRRQDLLAKGTDGLIIFRNNGNGTQFSFEPRRTYQFPATLQHIKDMDGDGRPDLVSAGFILKNTSDSGNISFGQLFSQNTAFQQKLVNDFDGDGKLDMLTADGKAFLNFHSNNQYLFLETPWQTTHYFGLLTEGDFNNDGKPDVAGIEIEARKMYVFLNSSTPGTILFTLQAQYNLPDEMYHLKTADIDNDIKPDLITVALEGNYFSIFRNTSTGNSLSFVAGNDFELPYVNVYNYDPHVTDLDGDGLNDIAFTRNNSALEEDSVTLYKNSSVPGSIHFKPRVNYPAARYAGYLATGDLNNDGMPEIVSGSLYSYGFRLFKNQTPRPVIQSIAPIEGTVGTIVTIKGLNFSNVSSVTFGAVAAASFTIVSDSLLTAVVGEGNSGQIGVTNLGITTYFDGFSMLPPVITSFSPSSGIVGSTVTITGARFSPVPSNNTVYFGAVKANVLAATTNTLQVQVPHGTSFMPLSVTTYQLTAYSTKPFTVTFPPVEGANITGVSFFERLDSLTGNYAHKTLVMDFDGDGRPDVIYLNSSGTNNVVIYPNASINKQIKLGAQKSIFTNDALHEIKTADFNGDGKPDFVISGVYGRGPKVFLNRSTPGNITFDDGIELTSVDDLTAIGIIDLNQDGKPDMIGVKRNTRDLFVYLNTSKNSQLSFSYFRHHCCTDYFSGAESIDIADMDNDGKPDIVVGENYTGILAVYRNSSNSSSISILDPVLFPAGSNNVITRIVTADLNGDDKPDVAAATDSIVILFKNNSTPGIIALSNNVQYSLGIVRGPNNIVVANLNGDTKPDIAAGNVSILKNNSMVGGNLSFSNPVKLSPVLQGSIFACDLNEDSKPDLVKGHVSILKNTVGDIAEFCPPVSSTMISSKITGTSYQWQLSTDGTTFSDIVDGGNFTGAVNQNLNLIDIPSSWAGRQIRCVTNNGTTDAVTIKFINRWVGTTTAWENTSNWSCSALPDSNTDVVILSGNLVINSAVIIRSLTTGPGVNIIVNAGFSLTVLR